MHWESQSITRADSETGLRYRNHERAGRSIMLFTRLRADDALLVPRPATYRGHVGEKPMAITWQLHTHCPATYISRSRQRFLTGWHPIRWKRNIQPHRPTVTTPRRHPAGCPG